MKTLIVTALLLTATGFPAHGQGTTNSNDKAQQEIIELNRKWAFKYKGREVNQERRYSHFYVKEKGQWRIVAQHVSSNLYKEP